MQVQIYIPPYKFQTCPLQGNCMPLRKSKCFSTFKAILCYSRMVFKSQSQKTGQGTDLLSKKLTLHEALGNSPLWWEIIYHTMTNVCEITKQFCSSSMHSYRGCLTPQLSNVSENVLEPTDYQSTLLAQWFPLLSTSFSSDDEICWISSWTESGFSYWYLEKQSVFCQYQIKYIINPI